MPRQKKDAPPRLRDRIIDLRRIPARDLQDHQANWRVHPAAQRDALQGVLSELGIASAFLVYDSPRQAGLCVIDGHLRKSLDPQQEWPCLLLDLDDDEAAYLLATHDPLGAMAEASRDALAALLQDVQSGSGAVQQMLADLAERSGVVPPGTKAPLVDEGEVPVDRAEELREQYGVEVGQLWACGAHRVVCGDCTDTAVMKGLLHDETPSAVVTDPPYDVGVDYATFDDSLSTVQHLIATFMPMLRGFEPIALTPGIPAMWLYPPPTWVLAWIHPAPTGSCPWGFNGLNPILVYGADPYMQRGLGRHPDHVVAVADRDGLEGHPTPKPLKAWRWLVERLTVEPGALVYDPFLGSGTTLIAAHQLGRVCRGVELAPAYVAVTLERWRVLTGETPTLVEG